MEDKNLVEVLLPLPFNQAFSYFAPEEMNLKIGDVVKVPFGKREIYGVVVGANSAAQVAAKKIKTVIYKDQSLKFDGEILDFIHWVAKYNMAAWGAVLKLAMAIIGKRDVKLTQAAYLLDKKAIPELRLTPPRKKIIEFFAAQHEAHHEKTDIKHNENRPFTARQIVAETGLTTANINALVKSGLLIKQEIAAEDKYQIPDYNFKLKKLSDEQEEAAQFLEQKIDEQRHSVTLIDGVTGSGKTEVYFRAIAKILTQTTGQILILLPEIVLTTQFLNRFEERFGFRPPMWHSKITGGNKSDIYYHLNDGSARIIVGARSALFLPFKKLALIIVDEEHEATFKQQDVVNYNGRDMAIVRAKIEEIPIILSSATPSLESYVNAQSGKYNYLVLARRFSQNLPTQIELVDMRKEKLLRGHHLSETLRREIEDNLKNSRQSLLFLNRRGYAPLTICRECGEKKTCINCSAFITYHQNINKLICHHCGYVVIASNDCTACGQKNSLITCGVGVERVREEVLKYFPQARIALITSDNIGSIEDAEKIIKQIIDGEIDIIIGTQMIAKGHHFPSLALIGIIDGDGSFYSGDLRNAERSYQLLTQVFGRAGRDKYQGKVILQTFNPDNEIFKNLNNRDEFLRQEIKTREIINMPPFSKMAALIFSSELEKMAIDAAKMVLREFPVQENIEVFGPAPMPITKLRGKYYYRLVIKFEKRIHIQKLIAQILSKVKIPSQVTAKVDIDPL